MRRVSSAETAYRRRAVAREGGATYAPYAMPRPAIVVAPSGERDEGRLFAGVTEPPGAKWPPSEIIFLPYEEILGRPRHSMGDYGPDTAAGDVGVGGSEGGGMRP